jgi:hypothetical protein
MENTTETETETKTKLITFLDPIGRTILGEQEQCETQFAVKNPVILHVVSDNQGRMSVQLLPLFFREFLADKSEDVIFYYNCSNITKTNLESLDFRLQAQYNQLFNKSNVFVPPSAETVNTGKSEKVVNLFEE